MMKQQLLLGLATVLVTVAGTGCGTFELAARPDPSHPHGYAAIQFWTPFGAHRSLADARPDSEPEVGHAVADESVYLIAGQ
jgi:hypothetical protein